ncbi:hypothetical protein OROMI_022027 [Orobanche minor]
MGFQSDERNSFEEAVILGVDGGATSTVCVCLPLRPLCEHRHLPDPLPVIGRADAGCSNQNSVGAQAARETLEHVIDEALSTAGKNHSAVFAVCLGVSGVNHPSDQERILNWMSITYLFAIGITLVIGNLVTVALCAINNYISKRVNSKRDMFPGDVKIYVKNDAVAALASGTMGKLHGCVLIAGTGCIAYGFTEDGREARAAGAGPVLGDWGSGFGIASRALTAVVKAHDGRGPETMLTSCFLNSLCLSSPDEIIGWTYADSSWARIAALVPLVVSCAESGDQVAHEILTNAVQELASSVIAVVRRLYLSGEVGEDNTRVLKPEFGVLHCLKFED